MDTEKLIELKQEIEEIKTSTSEKKVEQKSILKNLNKDWGCKTIEEAKELIKKEEKKARKIDRDINEKKEKLEKLLS